MSRAGPGPEGLKLALAAEGVQEAAQDAPRHCSTRTAVTHQESIPGRCFQQTASTLSTLEKETPYAALEEQSISSG